MDYKIKYLKYKTKYLQLLDQIGRGKMIRGYTIYSLIVTHNGRIRCLLDSLEVPAIEEKTKQEIRFMNCAILLLRITKDGYTISLEDEGNLAEESIKRAEKEKRKYYAKKNIGDIYTTFQGTGQVPKPLSLLQLTDDQIKKIGNNTYDFYIVRHGDGKHNSMTTFEKATSTKVTDAELTLDGIAQAEQATVYLSKIKIRIDNLYVSDLKRTRQTLERLIRGRVNRNEKLIEGRVGINGKEIVVLPCAHELDYVEGKNCDANQGIKSALSYENKVKCLADKDCVSNDICCKVNGLPINWSFYREFYGDGTRMKDGKNPSQKCRDTNMIQQAIIHIHKSFLD